MRGARAGGIDRINEQLHRRGLSIRVHADQRDRTGNAGTPQAMVQFLKDLVAGQIVAGAGLQVLLEALRNQEDPDSLFGALQGAPPAWLHMTGGFEGLCNDVGILELPGRRLICCAFVTGDPRGDWSELLSCLQSTGRRLYQDLTLNPETKAILDALLESRQILEAKLQAMDTKLEAVAADVTAIKEQLADMSAKDQHLTQKTGEL